MLNANVSIGEEQQECIFWKYYFGSSISYVVKELEKGGSEDTELSGINNELHASVVEYLGVCSIWLLWLLQFLNQTHLS